MKKKNITDLILKNAQTITSLTQAINQTLKDKAKNPQQWHEATQAFHDSYDKLAFPDGLKQGIQLLKEQVKELYDGCISSLTLPLFF